MIARIARRLRRLLAADAMEWKYQWYRFRMALARVDLSYVSLDDLGLNADRSAWHANSGGPYLDLVLKSIDISSSDAAIDIGCGKAGAMLTFLKYPFRRVDGVELSPRLARVAERNLKRAGKSNATIFCSDAASFEELDLYTVIFLFNPFPAVVMQPVLGNIIASARRRPRRITLIYKNPVCHEIVIQSGFRMQRRMEGCSYDSLPTAIYTLSSSGVEPTTG
jgi:hypothetical protein